MQMSKYPDWAAELSAGLEGSAPEAIATSLRHAHSCGYTEGHNDGEIWQMISSGLPPNSGNASRITALENDLLSERKASEAYRNSWAKCQRLRVTEQDEADGLLSRWRGIAQRAGVCMSCAMGSADPMGCTDCLGTGWEGGVQPEPAGREEIARLREEVERLRTEADGEFVQAAVRVMQANRGFDARDYAHDSISVDDFEAFFTDDMNEAWAAVEREKARADKAEAALSARPAAEPVAATSAFHVHRDARKGCELRDTIFHALAAHQKLKTGYQYLTGRTGEDLSGIADAVAVALVPVLPPAPDGQGGPV